VIFSFGLFCGVVIASTAADRDGNPAKPASDKNPPFNRDLRFSSCIINSFREVYTLLPFGPE
jgi:hypothetical protein